MIRPLTPTEHGRMSWYARGLRKFRVMEWVTLYGKTHHARFHVSPHGADCECPWWGK